MVNTLKGYAGKQIRIDLDRWEAQIEDVSAELSWKFLGGVGYATGILYNKLKP